MKDGVWLPTAYIWGKQCTNTHTHMQIHGKTRKNRAKKMHYWPTLAFKLVLFSNHIKCLLYWDQRCVQWTECSKRSLIRKKWFEAVHELLTCTVIYTLQEFLTELIYLNDKNQNQTLTAKFHIMSFYAVIVGDCRVIEAVAKQLWALSGVMELTYKHNTQKIRCKSDTKMIILSSLVFIRHKILFT